VAGIAAVPGVTRYNVQENPTNVTDAWGNPPHSITCTVEGGSDTDVANAIYLNRSIGCYTNGTTVVNVVDGITGVTIPIRFNRPTYVAMTVQCSVHIFYGDPAYWSAQIQTAIVNYLNSLQIGEILTTSGIYAVVMNLNADLDNPEFSVRSLTTGYTSCVTSVTINAAGTNYVVGDMLTILQTNSSNAAQVTVSTIGTGGAVTAFGGIPYPQNGVGYTTATGLATSGGKGSGCTVNIVAGTVNSSSDKGVGPTQVVQGLTSNVTVTMV
jgi:hypothetical protein